jgi:hypothetical protein
MDSADLRHLHRDSEVSRDRVNRIVGTPSNYGKAFQGFSGFLVHW